MEIDLADADAQHRARRLAELLYGSQQFRRRRQRAGAADAQRLVDAGNEEDQLHEAAPLDDAAETVDPVVAGAVGHQQPVRPGNNRIDSFRNIVEGSGFVQLIFFVPGIDETLRVGGTGTLSAAPELLAAMEEFGKPPRAVLSISVREAYFHCGKALMRAKLWSADTRVERAVMPSISEVVHDQTGLGEP